MYKKAEASFWTAEEINLLADLVDWTRLSDTEPHFIAHVLAFCTTSDGIVNENLSSNFTTKVTAPKARCIYGIQITVGNIHSKMYFLLINTYLKDCQKGIRLISVVTLAIQPLQPLLEPPSAVAGRV